MESLLFDREIGVTVKGGYDGTYAAIVGMTTVSGDLNVTAGSVTVENLIVE